MSVKKRGGVYHIDLTARRHGEKLRVRKSAQTKSKPEALLFEAQERAKLEASPFVRGRPPFFADFADEFLKTYSKANNKPSEHASKKMILDRHLKPFFGHLRLDYIGDNPMLVEKYKADKLEKLGKKSVNNHLICLAKLFAVAKDWGKVQRVPKIQRYKLEQGTFDFFIPEESDRLLAGAEGQWRTMILLGLRAGLRINELIALRWDDVDLVAGRVVVRHGSWEGIIGTPKGSKAVEVPLTEETCHALSTLPSRFARKLVFTGDKGAMLTRGSCNSPLWRACRKAGLREVGWHTLRHSFASQLAMAGVSLKAIQELGRWASFAMVLRYAHLTPAVRRDAVALLDTKERKIREAFIKQEAEK